MQRPPTATDGMHTGSRKSARRSKINAPGSDLNGTLNRLCARREIEAKIDSSDGLVDGMVYWNMESSRMVAVSGPREGRYTVILKFIL
jgi:hypothetical protein